MNLSVDIGNTSTRIGLFKDKHLIQATSIDNYSLKSIHKFVSDKEISSAIISSVKEIDSDILSILDYYKGIILSENTRVPIKNQYKTPSTLGKDRLAAVVGAYSLYPDKDIIVFDAGTCLTIDFINKKGEYIGGRISPGIQMRYKALNTFTDKLPLVKEKTTSIIGNDTYSSISTGVRQGILAEVNSVISEFRLQKPETIVIITGGDCFFFEKELKNSIFANPNLVLIGLNEILDFNE